MATVCIGFLSGAVGVLIYFVGTLLARMKRLEAVLDQLEDCWSSLAADCHG